MTDSPEGSPPSQGRRRRFLKRREEFEARANAFKSDIQAELKVTRAQLDAANVKIEARTGRNLPLAILIGLGLGLLMLFSLIVYKWLFMIFAGAIIGFTAFELASALRYAGRDVPRWPTAIAAVAMVPAAFYLGDAGHWLILLAAVLFVSLWRIADLVRPAHRASASELGKDIAAGALVQVYVPFLASFAVLLAGKDGGEWWTLAFLILVISVDTGAYASGLLLGRHAMAPRISPKKTWEGFAGSVLTALLAGVLLSLFMLHEPWWFGLVFGATIAFSATVGDLTESLVKRDLGIKDISTWLPGHGGFLDRLDSILPSAAAAYALFLIFG
jgi:phosphatidate cytidylyltransferase